jgi:hypothetical protein
MHGTLQAILSIVIPELVIWNGPVYDNYIRKPHYDETTSYMMEPNVKLCLFAAFTINNIDLTWRIPMLNDYMLMMSLTRNVDQYYYRLMFINLTNGMILPNYCYVITTIYDSVLHYVHCTEGLSYSQYWVQDHLNKATKSINRYVEIILKRMMNYLATIAKNNWNTFLTIDLTRVV